MTLRSQLPPGPRQPAAIQTIAWWARPVAFLERARARYGKRFTVRLLATPPFVMISEPDQLKELFAAPPDVLHPGEGARILEPVVGSKSLILLDETEHLAGFGGVAAQRLRARHGLAVRGRGSNGLDVQVVGQRHDDEVDLGVHADRLDRVERPAAEALAERSPSIGTGAEVGDDADALYVAQAERVELGDETGPEHADADLAGHQ